jgi:hypothetical protein
MVTVLVTRRTGRQIPTPGWFRERGYLTGIDRGTLTVRTISKR